MAQNDQQFIDALEAFDRVAPSATVNKEDLCTIYKRVKPILNGILPFIELIPVWGKRATGAIRLLMQGLDALCP